jgi:hypothetical protein
MDLRTKAGTRERSAIYGVISGAGRVAEVGARRVPTTGLGEAPSPAASMSERPTRLTRPSGARGRRRTCRQQATP